MVCREKATTEIAFVRFEHREQATTDIVFERFEHCQCDWRKYIFCFTLLVNKSCECVYKKERNRSSRNIDATMPHNVANSC